MTKLTKPQYRLATIASVLGILEGTVWILLSGMFIPIILGSPFLDGKLESDYIIVPRGLVVFLCIYLITDFIWVVVSIWQLCAINKTHSNCLNVFKCWAVIAFLIAFIDFILVVLVGVDYNVNCIPDSGERICTPVFIPVLVVAAKGFILWIVNVIFVYVFYRIIRTIQSGKNLSRSLPSADPQIPRTTLQPSTNNWPNQSNESNQNNWSNQSAPYNNNDNFLNNNPRPVSYDGMSPPTGPTYYPVQRQQSFAKY